MAKCKNEMGLWFLTKSFVDFNEMNLTTSHIGWES